MNEAVRGLSGGKKQMWLRQPENRRAVLRFYGEHGPEATMAEYDMKRSTWDHFLDAREVNWSKMTKADRALAIAQASTDRERDLVGRVAALERRERLLEPYAKALYAFSVAMQMVAQLPMPEFPPFGESVSLDISDVRLNTKSAKRSRQS